MHIQNMREFVRDAVRLGGRADQDRNENGQFAYEGGPKAGRGSRGHLPNKIMGDDELIGRIHTDAGIPMKVAGRVFNNIRDYTGDGYGMLRAYQTGDLKSRLLYTAKNLDRLKKMDADVETYIKSAPAFKGTIYRSIGIPSSNFDSFAVGNVIDMKGTSSWSSTKGGVDISHYGNNNVLFVSSNVEKSTSIRHLSKRAAENEVLVSKTAKFKVTSVKRITSTISTDKIIVDVEEL